MVEKGKAYVNSRSGGRLTVIEHWDDTGDRRMRIERTMPPGTGKGEPHLHLDFTQTWEGVQGDGMVMVDGTERPLRAGDRVEIPPGVKHRDPWNAGGSEIVVRGQFEPVPEFIKAYAEAYVNRAEAGKGLTDQDEFGLLQIFVLAKATDGQSYGALPPVWLQRAGLPLGALIGRVRGYRASYD